MLTYEQVIEVLNYNPKSGLIKWKDSVNKRFTGISEQRSGKPIFVLITNRFI